MERPASTANGQGALGDELRRRRAELGLTQEELAERTGLSVRAISDIERGRTPRPRRSSTSRLATVLGFDDDLGSANGEFAEPDRVVPRQLPTMAARLVGRGPEIAALNGLLDGLAAGGQPAAVVAISGTAGVGKTALALWWAHQVTDRFPDGQLYLDLRGFGPASPVSPSEAMCGFLEALSVPPARIPVHAEARAGLYRSLLAGRRMLVLLDNASDAEHVSSLLPGSSASLALVTSRNPLTGLAVAHGARLVSLSVLTAGDAQDLLTSRLGAERTAGEPAAARALVELTAGLPLALSIAAARATAHPSFPLATLAAELRDARGRLEALAGGDPSADVRAAISWSYRRLSEPAARLFRLLGLHPGPEVTVPAAASLGGTSWAETRRALAELMAAGLVTEQAPGRFAGHDLLRACALELAQERDPDAARRQALTRLLDHYLHTAHAALLIAYPTTQPVPLARPSPGTQAESLATVPEAVAWLSAEHQVLLSACDAAVQHGFDRQAWQLPLVMVPFLSPGGHWLDWIAALRAGLAAARRLDDETGQASVLRRLGQAHAFIGDGEEGASRLGAALRAFCLLGDRLSMAYTYTAAAVMRDKEQRFRGSLSLARRALVLFRACGHQAGLAVAWNIIGWAQVQLGDRAAALASSQEALRLCHAVGDRPLAAATLDTLGLIYFRLGQRAEAISHYEQAIAEFLGSEQRLDAAATLETLGDVHRQVGDPAAAAAAWRQALDIVTEMQSSEAAGVQAKLKSVSRLPGRRPGCAWSSGRPAA